MEDPGCCNGSTLVITKVESQSGNEKDSIAPQAISEGRTRADVPS